MDNKINECHVKWHLSKLNLVTAPHVKNTIGDWNSALTGVVQLFSWLRKKLQNTGKWKGRQRTHKRQWKKLRLKCKELAAAGKKTRAEERGSNHLLTTTIVLKGSQQGALKRAMYLKIWMEDYIKWEKDGMKHCRWVKMIQPQVGMSGKCKVGKETRQSASNEQVPWLVVTVAIKWHKCQHIMYPQG